MSRKRKPDTDIIRRVSEQIACDLLTYRDVVADRLVQVVESNGKRQEYGGWCQVAIADRVESLLRDTAHEQAYIVLQRAIALLTERTNT